MRYAVAMLAVALVSVAAGPPAVPLSFADDYAAILGEWEAVSGTTGGTPADPAGRRMLFRRDGLTIMLPRNPVPRPFVYTYHLAPQRNPRWLTYGKGNGVAIVGAAVETIYRLEGDVFQMCYGLPARPKDFRAAAGQNT